MQCFRFSMPVLAAALALLGATGGMRALAQTAPQASPGAGASQAAAGSTDLGEGPAILDHLVQRDETVDPVREERVVFKPGHATFTRELSETGPGASVDVTIPVPTEGVLFEGVTTPVPLRELQLTVTVSKFKNGKPESDFQVGLSGLQSATVIVPKNISKQQLKFKVKVAPGADAGKPGRVVFDLARGGIAPLERARRKVTVDVDFEGDSIPFNPPCQSLGCKMRRAWGIVKPSGDLLVPYLAALVWLVIVVFGRDNAFRMLAAGKAWPVVDAAVWATVGAIVLYFSVFGLIFTMLPQVAWGSVATGPFWLALACIALVLSGLVLVA